VPEHDQPLDRGRRLQQGLALRQREQAGRREAVGEVLRVLGKGAVEDLVAVTRASYAPIGR
jgi:hypothetical protein